MDLSVRLLSHGSKLGLLCQVLTACPGSRPVAAASVAAAAATLPADDGPARPAQPGWAAGGEGDQGAWRERREGDDGDDEGGGEGEEEGGGGCEGGVVAALVHQYDRVPVLVRCGSRSHSCSRALARSARECVTEASPAPPPTTTTTLSFLSLLSL